MDKALRIWTIVLPQDYRRKELSRFRTGSFPRPAPVGIDPADSESCLETGIKNVTITGDRSGNSLKIFHHLFLPPDDIGMVDFCQRFTAEDFPDAAIRGSMTF